MAAQQTRGVSTQDARAIERMMQTYPVLAGADLVHDGGLKIDEDGARDMLARAGLGEEGLEAVALVLALVDGAIRADAWAAACEQDEHVNRSRSRRGRRNHATLSAAERKKKTKVDTHEISKRARSFLTCFSAESSNGNRGMCAQHTVLEAVELPAGIADLDTGLAEVDRDDLTHVDGLSERRGGDATFAC